MIAHAVSVDSDHGSVILFNGFEGDSAEDYSAEITFAVDRGMAYGLAELLEDYGDEPVPVVVEDWQIVSRVECPRGPVDVVAQCAGQLEIGFSQ